MSLVSVTSNPTIKYQESLLSVSLIKNQNALKDLLYLTVNISTKFSTIFCKLNELRLSKSSKL